MENQDRESLIAHIRSLGIDNFRILGDTLHIGNRVSQVRRCHCGSPSCDGWELVRLPGPPGPGSPSHGRH